MERRPVVKTLPRKFDEFADVVGGFIGIELDDECSGRGVEDGLKLFEVFLGASNKAAKRNKCIMSTEAVYEGVNEWRI